MEYIKVKQETAQKALLNLKKGIDRFELIKDKIDQDEDEFFERRDSLIKRFELSFDTLWKYAKVYLEVKTGILQNSPKAVFRELLRINLISEESTKHALQLVDDRNATTHTYQEEIAKEICADIPLYYDIMKTIFEALKI